MHYIFLVHGSGRNSPGWSQPFCDTLIQKATTITGKTSSQLQSEVQFVEINYAQKLNNLLDQLVTGGDSLGKVNEWLKAAHDRRKTGQPIVDGGSESSIAANITLEFLVDSLLYLWNPEMVNYIHLKIADQVLPVIKAAKPGDQFSFLGHGMGAKVLFDFLHKSYSYGNDGLFKLSSNGSPTHDSPIVSYLYLIANTSFGLNKLNIADRDPNTSHVRRYSRARKPAGIVRRAYRIFSHDYDWLSRIGQNDKISQDKISEHVILKTVTGLKLHSLKNYLKHPAVHLRLVEDLFMNQTKLPNRNQLIAAYDISENKQQVLEDIRSALNNYGEDGALKGKIAFFDFLKNTSEMITKIIADEDHS